MDFKKFFKKNTGKFFFSWTQKIKEKINVLIFESAFFFKEAKNFFLCLESYNKKKTNKTLKMGGGLMQLVAYGAQDIYLTGNPQITFFKVVYRRHTNFAMEAIE